MSLMSLKDLYVAELADLHDAETQALTLLPRLGELARAPELRQTLARHAEESRLHVERLQLIFTRLGERADGRHCHGLAGIVQEADDRLNQAATDDARDAGIIGMVQRIEHYEIAAYGCARTYARRLNRTDEARLLQETLEEERRADRRLTEMAEAHINDDARTEADLHELPPPRKLRYVDASRLDYSKVAGHGGSLAVRNDSDDELGTFGGLIFNADTSRPEYIVVESGGFIGGHRYLLPVSEVRLDPTDGLLRVTLSKDVASRYPPFDPDEFAKMDERELRGYESKLLTFFDRGDRRAGDVEDEFIPPEWLMTGVWVPVGADRAETLRDETRGFSNEFLPNREQAVARADAEPPSAGDRATLNDTREIRHDDRPGSLAVPEQETDTPTPPHGDKLRG